MSSTEIRYGPHLIARASGSLRAALVMQPTAAIETLPPLIGEPNAIFKRALDQHGILVETLKYFGVDVTVCKGLPGNPPGASVTDLAVCFENGAVLMNPRSLAQTAGLERIEKEFAAIDIPLNGHLVPPAILDGSDVLLAGETAFIGISRRSNASGRAAFSAIARANGYRPVEVHLDLRAPSLRAVASAVSSDTIVVATERVEESAFAGFRLVRLERGEELGAGVFPLGDGRVVANMRYRTSLDQIRRAGVAVESIDLYEFGKVGIAPANLILALKRK
ncbi:MAG: hypothetical protein NVS9B12_01270 [Vulcanimicrobiaceae bacterium]